MSLHLQAAYVADTCERLVGELLASYGHAAIPLTDPLMAAAEMAREASEQWAEPVPPAEPVPADQPPLW